MRRLVTRTRLGCRSCSRVLSADPDVVIYVAYARRVTRYTRGVRSARFANTRYIVSHCNGNCGTIGAQPTCQYALLIGSDLRARPVSLAALSRARQAVYEKINPRCFAAFMLRITRSCEMETRERVENKINRIFSKALGLHV